MGAIAQASQLAAAQPVIESLNAIGTRVVDAANNLARLASDYHALVSGLDLDAADQTEIDQRFAAAASAAAGVLDQLAPDSRAHLDAFLAALGYHPKAI